MGIYTIRLKEAYVILALFYSVLFFLLILKNYLNNKVLVRFCLCKYNIV